jgi:hypothetical protein
MIAWLNAFKHTPPNERVYVESGPLVLVSHESGVNVTFKGGEIRIIHTRTKLVMVDYQTKFTQWLHILLQQ